MNYGLCLGNAQKFPSANIYLCRNVCFTQRSTPMTDEEFLLPGSNNKLSVVDRQG